MREATSLVWAWRCQWSEKLLCLLEHARRNTLQHSQPNIRTLYRHETCYGADAKSKHSMSLLQGRGADYVADGLGLHHLPCLTADGTSTNTPHTPPHAALVTLAPHITTKQIRHHMTRLLDEEPAPRTEGALLERLASTHGHIDVGRAFSESPFHMCFH